MKHKLRVGIVGAGVFGGYHVNKAIAHPDVDCIGVYDPNPYALDIINKKNGVKGFSNLDIFLGAVDAVIIASPATTHFDMTRKALLTGCHALVEKPLADKADHGRAMIDMAKERGLCLQVGHQERFILSAIGLDRLQERPSYIHCCRESSYSRRGTDVSVTLDMMVHDLDMVMWLLGSVPDQITGQTRAVHSDCSDTASAVLTFSECKAEFIASRVADKVKRTMHLTYPSGEVEIDFVAKTLSHNTPFDLDKDFAQNPLAKDPLMAADEAFFKAVRDQRAPQITGEAGLAAIKAAQSIEESV